MALIDHPMQPRNTLRHWRKRVESVKHAARGQTARIKVGDESVDITGESALSVEHSRYSAERERAVLDTVVSALEPGDRLLDIGSGVGVHAIAAALAGAEVVTVDADPERVGWTQVNAARNGVAGRVDARHQIVGPDGFDNLPNDVDVAKIDIEGAEWELLSNATAIPSDTIILEVHPDMKPERASINDIRNHLDGRGFELAEIKTERRQRVVHLIAER